jgi:hypothetical protein
MFWIWFAKCNLLIFCEVLNFMFEFSQRLHEENEKLFDRLTEKKASVAGSPMVGKFHYIPG